MTVKLFFTNRILKIFCYITVSQCSLNINVYDLEIHNSFVTVLKAWSNIFLYIFSPTGHRPSG